MLSVHTNYASLVSQNSVTKNNDLLSNAMERLSTGLRINSASDDAAGLQIATRMNANVTGMETASRNVNDATSMLQTADGALDELNNIATRQKELATQAANGVNSAEDLKALNAEFGELTKEITRIVSNTEYSGNKLFDSLKTGVDFQIGAGSTEKLNVKVTDTNIKAHDAKLDTAADASAAIDKINTYINSVGTERSNLGANINRLS
ncbi:Lateral flagellin, partial [Shewanella sp.]|nr:Lateral flagellin [Shewanella sp.]